jgi:hypothetical protein
MQAVVPLVGAEPPRPGQVQAAWQVSAQRRVCPAPVAETLRAKPVPAVLWAVAVQARVPAGVPAQTWAPLRPAWRRRV